MTIGLSRVRSRSTIKVRRSAYLLNFHDSLVSRNREDNIFSHDPIAVYRPNHQRADFFFAFSIASVASEAWLLHVRWGKKGSANWQKKKKKTSRIHGGPLCNLP